MNIFVIEDEAHAELCGEFETFETALKELKKRILIPWNQKPNVCPCQSWETCGRNYEIIEYDTAKEPWTEINTTDIFEISAKGIVKNEKYI